MQQQSRGPSVERQLKRLTELLTLTADQQTQVKAILTDQRQQMVALFKQASSGGAAAEDQPPTREAMESMRAEMKTIHAAAQAKIAALLTADQKVTYAAWNKKHERASARQENDDMPPPPPDGEGGPPPDGGGGPAGAGPGGGGPGGGGPPGV
jgi:Spy/CpxP family protein refolding chaperone